MHAEINVYQNLSKRKPAVLGTSTTHLINIVRYVSNFLYFAAAYTNYLFACCPLSPRQ